jgi:Na+-transporting NADH:ubiquinone oxidoreductase subunit B
LINPALGGIAFLFLIDPTFFSIEALSTSVDAYSAPTALMLAKKTGLSLLIEEMSWRDAWMGQIMGVIGETSKIAIVFGAVILIITGIGSWRIMLGGILGLTLTALIFNGVGSVLNPMYYLPWYWHLLSGGFLFALVFMATDPVTAPMTSIGRWVYGVFIGVLTVVIRVLSPAYIEGVMMAILVANLCAPTLDRLIVVFRQWMHR